MKPLGNNLMAATASSGQVQLLQPGTVGAGVLNQGALEASNVNVVEEMVNMTAIAVVDAQQKEQGEKQQKRKKPKV